MVRLFFCVFRKDKALFNYVNQYSFVIVAGVVLIFSSTVLLRLIGWKTSISVFVVISLVLLFIHMTMKTESGLDLTETEWIALSNSYRPFLLYLYSDL